MLEAILVGFLLAVICVVISFVLSWMEFEELMSEKRRNKRRRR